MTRMPWLLWPGRRARVAAIVLLLPTASCAGLDDPSEQAGSWNPEGLNNANIAAMVANPRDLAWGVNDPVSPGQLSAVAVRRLLTDRTKPLVIEDVGSSGAPPSPPSNTGNGEGM